MKKTPTMRFFHIAYDVMWQNKEKGIGSLTCSRYNFISKKEIDIEARKDDANFKNLVVTSIFEFKNEDDIKAFIA